MKVIWDKVKRDYIESKGEIVLTQLADKYKVKINTLRSRKSRENWDAEINKCNAMDGETQWKKSESIAMDESNSNTESVNTGTNESNDKNEDPETNSQHPMARPGNKNALGNKGGVGGPEGNKKAEVHGFFSKYLPKETLELTQLIQEKLYIDILWENITIQYAAIIRAQRIMYVKDQKDSTQLIKKQKIHESEMSSSSETEYEHHMSWDKQATFLQAQSRAMSELRSMIKQYDDLVNNGLATEEQKLRIEKLKQDINNTKGIDEADNQGVQDFIQATTMSQEEIKELFENEDDEDGEEEETH